MEGLGRGFRPGGVKVQSSCPVSDTCFDLEKDAHFTVMEMP